MSNNQVIIKLNKFLKIMADETRLRIMFSLLENKMCKCNAETKHCSSCKCLSCMIELSVNRIVEKVGLSQSLISHQLKVLKDAEMVASRREGRTVYYKLKDGHIKELLNIAKEHLEE